MVTNKWTVIGAVIISAGFAWYFFIHESPEKQIKKQFAYLADKMEKQTGESPIITAGTSKNAADVFVDGCTIDIPEYGTQKKFAAKDLAQHILAYKSRIAALKVQFYDLSINLTDDNRAIATVTAMVRATTPQGEIEEDIREFEVRLEKIDDAWLFDHVTAVEVLEK